MSIDKIRNIGLDKLVTQVYDFDSLTTDELLCKFAQKINIIIEHFNYLDKQCQNNNENVKLKLEYLLGEGLEEQVAKRLIELTNNGTLGKLINETLLKDINDKVDYITTKVTEINVKEFGAKGDAYYFDANSKKFYVDSDFTILATDDSIYFQNAINTLIENGGGRLTIPEGNYYFSNSVYINPPKPGVTIELSGIASRTGWEDYWNFDNGVYKKGVNILCDVNNVFLTNCKEDGNQFLGSETASFDGFYCNGIRFVGMFTGYQTVNSIEIPTFKKSTALKIIGTRYEVENCSIIGMDNLIYQPLILPNGKYNYSDFIRVNNISSRWTGLNVVRCTRCDVSEIKNINNEQAQPTLSSVVNIVGGTNVIVENISGSMNNDYNLTNVVGESGILRINSCDCVKASSIYSERNTNLQATVSVIDSTNVKLFNIGEHSFNVDTKNSPILYMKNSDVYVNGLHGRAYRKLDKPDIEIVKATDGSVNSKLEVKFIDLKDSFDSSQRELSVSDIKYLKSYKNDELNEIEVKYDNEAASYKVYENSIETSNYGTPTFDNGVLTFKFVSEETIPKLLRMKKQIIRTVNKINEIGYTPVIISDQLTIFQVVFYDYSNSKVSTSDIKCCFKLKFI